MFHCIPALRDMLSIDVCTSLLGGISFHVARNTLRSEGEWSSIQCGKDSGVQRESRVEGGGVRMGGGQEGVREQKEEDERERQRGSKEKEG